MSILRQLVALVTVAVLLLSPFIGRPASAETGCTFALGFKALRDQIPEIVGECVEDERFNPANGNVEQQTTGGLLVWRQEDNWTAFTDGSLTWVNGPNGLHSRANGERFAWERPAWADTTALGESRGTGRAPRARPPASAQSNDVLSLIDARLHPAWKIVAGSQMPGPDGRPFGTWMSEIVRASAVRMTVVRQASIPGAHAVYSPERNVIGIADRLMRDDPRAIATAIVHETVHALQGYTGQPSDCVHMEVQAFTVQTEFWMALWPSSGGYGPSRTPLEQDSNFVVRIYKAAGVRGIHELVAYNPDYQRQCRHTFEAGFDEPT